MNIIRSFLLLFLLATQVQADTIYSLIKIPNLEIYKINTTNKLRYLYAVRPFRLGVNVKKNIYCSSPDKQNLDSKFKIINKNLNRYSSQFLKKINLRYIVLCKNLSIAKIKTAGIPNKLTRTLIIDINFNEKFFERAIHHEVFHMINDSHKDLFNKEEWQAFNKKKFKYSECSTCNNGWNLELYNKTDGFLTEYSKSTASEDMAEIFSHLMFFQDKIYMDDQIIEKKIQFIKNNILRIDNTFNFR